MIAKSHFDDCPYGCNINGKILNPDTGWVDCPHCSKKKKELLKQGCVEEEISSDVVPLATVLGINNEYLSTKFVYEGVVPDGERLFIEEDSLKLQKELADELYLSLSIGDVPKQSLCFGISIKGRFDRFAYPMLAKAFMSGLTIGRFVSCSEFNRLSFDINNSLNDFYEADFLMMFINDGSNLSDLSAAKGLMQTRSLKGKPTVFVTTWTIQACSGLLSSYDDVTLSLAKPIFLSYKSSKSKGNSNYINNLLGVENEDLSSKKSESRGVSMGDLLSM